MEAIAKMAEQIARGSLADIARQQGQNLATIFATGVDVLLLVDRSGSMSTNDVGGRARYRVEDEQLAHLQARLPGKIAIVSFGSFVTFHPDGVLPRPSGGTDLARALSFCKVVSDAGIPIMLISDGEPDSEDSAMAVARTYTTRIDVIYVGPEDDHYGGRAFLKLLARTTGGRYAEECADGLRKLKQTVQLLLTGG